MQCPYCFYHDSKVTDSRSFENGKAIKRRRECLSCAKRFNTFEKVESLPFFVIKKDGRREPFSKEKILNGLIKAFEKRPVSLALISSLADKIESELQRNNETEVSTAVIGEVIMGRVIDIDQVAYVRFASVYKQFADASIFLQEVQKILDK